MDIRWTTEASSNLEQISLRIAEDKPEAAIGREKGTRELVLSPLPYIAVYRVRESTIEILHIWHGAQDRD